LKTDEEKKQRHDSSLKKKENGTRGEQESNCEAQ